MLKTAIEAAKKAACIHRKYYRNVGAVKFKGTSNNLVTKVDVASERVIKETLKKAYPSHGFICEENGTENVDNEYRWIIDPLDGTVNYAHGFPLFCVSIALQRNGVTKLGVVYAPVLDEMFTSEAGKGARLNGKRVLVSRAKTLENSLLATGFPYSLKKDPGSNLVHFNSFCMKAQAVRRGGSAALDLCYVGCGIYDGFFEQGLYAWDTAAGMLFIEEAKGRVTDYGGNKFDNFQKTILASNGLIHEEMLKVLEKRVHRGE